MMCYRLWSGSGRIVVDNWIAPPSTRVEFEYLDELFTYHKSSAYLCKHKLTYYSVKPMG